MATSCRTVSVAAEPMSLKRAAWRQISTSIVDVRTSPRMRTTPKEVNVNTKTTPPPCRAAGRIAGRVIPEHLRRRRPSVAGRLTVAGNVARTGADRAHDDGEVEEHVATTIATTPCSIEAGRAASTAAPSTTVGSTNTATRALSSRRRPGKSKRAMT